MLGRKDKRGLRMAAGLGIVLAAFAGYGAFWAVSGQGVTLQPLGQPSPMTRELPTGLFQDWPQDRKPAVVLLLSGQQHSYLKFCGCTERQLGGFERRYNFAAKLRERGWPVVGADLGDLVNNASGTLHEQTLLKYDAAIKSLAAIGYSALGVGEFDFKLPLLEGLSNNVLQDAAKFPTLLCANLENRTVNYPGLIGDTIIRGGTSGAPKIGFTCIVGPSVSKNVINGDKFSESKPALLAALEAMKKGGAELRVLLYQGNFESARFLAGGENIKKEVDPTFRDKFDVILCLSAEEEPPGKAESVGKTMIVRVGQRGRYVATVGVFPSGKADKPFDLQFQMVDMSEDYETDPDRETSNPILKILDEYASEVKKQELVKKVPQTMHPVQLALPNKKVVYVGSDRCNQCHQKEYAIWQSEIVGSKKHHSHSKAFDALVKYAKKPKLRQFDPECVVCHTVGYGFESGYHGETAAQFKNVGCENCHGPGSAHVADPNNAQVRKLLSPWKSNPNDLLPTPERLKQGYNALTQPEQRIHMSVNDLCQKCHDTDNDPTFKFEQFWPRIRHGRGTQPQLPP